MEFTEIAQFVQYVIIPAILFIAGVGLKVYAALNKEKLSASQEDRLNNLSNMAVTAAEEIGKREGWSAQEKGNYARDIIEEALPLIESKTVEAAIHASLVTTGLGKSDK